MDKRKDFCGVLRSFDGEAVVIEVQDGQEMTIERDNIALIRLKIDF